MSKKLKKARRTLAASQAVIQQLRQTGGLPIDQVWERWKEIFDAAPLDALHEAEAAAWEKGVATALDHAKRNPDGITLRLEHFDGSPWLNPYRGADRG